MEKTRNALDFDCDWRFGFNLSSRGKGTVGYLLTWSGLGGLNLVKDIEVWNPFNSAGQTVTQGKTIQCIGLLESFRFEGNQGDPIRCVAYVSKGTAADLRNKMSRPIPNTKLKIAWYIIDFDEEEKAWYEAAFVKTPKQADACLDTAGGALQLFVDNEATKISETLDINVYKVEWQVVPAKDKKNILEFASGPARRMVRAWGDVD